MVERLPTRSRRIGGARAAVALAGASLAVGSLAAVAPAIASAGGGGPTRTAAPAAPAVRPVGGPGADAHLRPVVPMVIAGQRFAVRLIGPIIGDPTTWTRAA